LVTSNGQVGGGVPPGGSLEYGSWQWQCQTSTQYVQSFPADGSGIGGDRCIAPDGSTYWWCTAGTGGGGGGHHYQYRIVNGVVYFENNYPGIDDGLPWVWWVDEDFIEQFWQEDYQGSYNTYYYEYNKLTQAERDLIKRFPLQAIEIRKNKEIAFRLTESKFPNSNGRNDKADAFRHCLWNTLNTISIGRPLAESFGTAHESETPANLTLEKSMDLWNNSIGYDFGEIFNTSLNGLSNDDNFVADYIIQKGVVEGLLKYLSPINYGDLNFPATGGISIGTNLKFTNL
jgi:hypothetical protein